MLPNEQMLANELVTRSTVDRQELKNKQNPNYTRKI